METLKRIGNPFEQVLKNKKMTQKNRYAPLSQDEEHMHAASAYACDLYKRLLALSITMNVATLVIFGFVYFHFKAIELDSCGAHELESDRLWGHIPWKLQLIDNNQRFIDARPPDYMVGEVGINKTESTNPWDEIYPSVWVALSQPSRGSVDGWGMKMKHVAAEPGEWDEDSEGYGIAVMHQVHCVAVVKHALITYEDTGKFHGDQDHLHHCVETLRQAVMCHADMTLEHPGMDNPHDVVLTGWGNTHMCRDWDTVITAISKHAIKHTKEGWAKFAEGELKTRTGL